jgi:hypothetical protein
VIKVAITILFALLQNPPTGTVLGSIKLPQGKSAQARVVLLPPKYVETWDKQVQTRIDNYWEVFKPEFAANKERYFDFDRLARIEAFRSVTATMRRELGVEAAIYIKDATPAGQFSFTGIPYGSYQMLVYANVNGQELLWSKSVVVQTEIPIFVDPGTPVS